MPSAGVSTGTPSPARPATRAVTQNTVDPARDGVAPDRCSPAHLGRAPATRRVPLVGHHGQMTAPASVESVDRVVDGAPIASLPFDILASPAITTRRRVLW